VTETWNDTAVQLDPGLTLQSLVERKAAENPGSLAVISTTEEHLTYADLVSRANRLANYLRAVGADRGRTVGICLKPGIALPVALLAMVKSGAAYVPLDPNLPAERLALMARDADVNLFVTTQDLAARLRSVPGSVVLLDADAAVISACPDIA